MINKLILIDCDGTMTDGKLAIDAQNNITLNFHVHDGMMMSYLAKRPDIIVAIISGGNHPSCANRAKYLGVDEYHPAIKDKRPVGALLQAKYSVSPANTIAIGDDINDIGMFDCAEVKIAVANAHPDLKKHATLITQKPGGYGAIREALDTFFTIEINLEHSNVSQ